ncbi:MAG: S8 family peptidase [Sporichthyaceae bacterium]
MTGEPRPLLALSAPASSNRAAQSSAFPGRPSTPSAARQGERLSPRFQALADAFDAKRARLSAGVADEIDPELVVVFDLAGTVEAFHNAIKHVEGLEFLAEMLDEDAEPDDDFYMTRRDEPTDDTVPNSLCLVMSNARAVEELLRLFALWQNDQDVKLERGLNKFKSAFQQLRTIRRWDARDRVRETGLLEEWRETVEVAGQSPSPRTVELELWFRNNAERRRAAEGNLTQIVASAGGRVLTTSQIPEIGYHAMLVEISVQQVDRVLNEGAEAIELLTADEIMFVNPYTPMSVAGPDPRTSTTTDLAPVARIEKPPRIALLDGLPFANHNAVAGRLDIDDPDGLATKYPVDQRRHGTAMASLIVHGDLSGSGPPLDRPIHVRPVLQPHAFNGEEAVLPGELFTDLLHRAIRRIVEGDGTRPAAAPSVRIVNLSIGAESRAVIRRVSPSGRLLDWLAVRYNLLFVVSAGNHHRRPVTIPTEAAHSIDTARPAAFRSARAMGRHRSVLPPGDAINALTVGARHLDDGDGLVIPSSAWDLIPAGMPALYSAIGPGASRSIKPEIHHAGGRALYLPPAVEEGAAEVQLVLARTQVAGPGHQVAAAGGLGALDATAFCHGSSNAAALVSREASGLFDLLEAGVEDEADASFPDAQYFPVLVKALLVHASSWGEEENRLRTLLALGTGREARRDLTNLLGYGSLHPPRLGTAATNRAVLIGAGSIGRDERHTHLVPLPPSLRAKADWHRFTVTLAYFAPTVGGLNRYRGAKVFFEKLGDAATGGSRIDADRYAARRGSVQHELVEGREAMVFGDGESLPIHVECMDDAQRLQRGTTIRYGLVVSVETAATTSTTIHDEIRAHLRARTMQQAAQRVQR